MKLLNVLITETYSNKQQTTTHIEHCCPRERHIFAGTISCRSFRFLFRRLRSFGVQGALLETFYDSVVASAVFFGVVCWGSRISTADRKRLDRLNRRASSVLGYLLDPVEVVGQRRMMAKLSSFKDNQSHPLQDTITALGSSSAEGEVSQFVPHSRSYTVQPALLLVKLHAPPLWTAV